MYGPLRLRDVARRQHAGHVRRNVDVLQVPEGLRVVQADGGRVLERHPQADARLRHLVNRTGRYDGGGRRRRQSSPRPEHRGR